MCVSFNTPKYTVHNLRIKPVLIYQKKILQIRSSLTKMRPLMFWLRQVNASVPFDFVKDLPVLHAATKSVPNWGDDKKIKAWTMFLFSICVFGRASDVTTYCPLLSSINLPESAHQWDADGYPDWLEVTMLYVHAPLTLKLCTYIIRLYIHRWSL